MSKKSHQKPKSPGAAPGADPGPPPERKPTMQTDTAQPEDHRDPQDGVAVIRPVTDTMMEHAAHEAAVLADGVARGAIDPGHAVAAEAADAALPGAAAPAAAGGAERLVQAAVATMDDASEAAIRPTEDTAREAERVAGRENDAAREALSASAGALSRYNAKVVEVMQVNVAATTALFAALIQAKSVPEALSLNADHMRRQMETLASQGRELATLAQRVALDALQPFKGPAER